MDCHSHTWLEAPSMLVARHVPSTCILDGKIYVTGGTKNLDASNWIEVFDTKTKTWEFLLSDNSEKICNGYKYQSIAYDGTVYVNSRKSYLFHKLHKGIWRPGDVFLNRRWLWLSSACVIDNVLYSFSDGRIDWYDSEAKHWKEMKGLERSFASLSYSEVKLADYGGKLAICWEEVVFVNGLCHKRKIWCGKIAIVKCQGGEIWGHLSGLTLCLHPMSHFM